MSVDPNSPEHRTNFAVAFRNAMHAAEVDEPAAVELMVELGADAALEYLTNTATRDPNFTSSIADWVSRTYTTDTTIAIRAVRWGLLSYWAGHRRAPRPAELDRVVIGALETIILTSLAARHPDLRTSV